MFGSAGVAQLEERGKRVLHGDIRQAADLEGLKPQDWLIDVATNPSMQGLLEVIPTVSPPLVSSPAA